MVAHRCTVQLLKGAELIQSNRVFFTKAVTWSKSGYGYRDVALTMTCFVSPVILQVRWKGHFHRQPSTYSSIQRGKMWA